MVPSAEGDTDFFDMVAGVLRGDTVTPYLLPLYQDCELQTSIDLKKMVSHKKKEKRGK